MLLEILGWIGTFCFSTCTIPQAWVCYRNKTAGTLSWSFLWLWLVGLLANTAYILPTKQYPLLVTYFFSYVTLGVMLYYKVRDWTREHRG